MTLKMKILICFLLVILFVAIGWTTFFIIRRPKLDERQTAYDVVKNNKMDNYTYLNTNGFAEKNQTILIGDSITEIYNIQEFYGNYTRETGCFVYNRGISGDTSDRLLERLEKNALNITPKNLTILIGTNDLGRGIGVDIVIENIRAMIDKTKELSPTTNLIVQGVYPVKRSMNPGMVGRRDNQKIKELNEKIKQSAEEKGVTYLDLYGALSDESGELNAEYSYDGLHLNAKGFNVVTNGILPLLK